jgi:hypothetical protein
VRFSRSDSWSLPVSAFAGFRFPPLLADAARFARRAPGDRWYTDETNVKVNGV